MKSYALMIRAVVVAGLLLTFCFSAPAQQYRGAPVKKERLLKALRSKLLQTRDIVAVINSNGVDFALTDETRSELVAAGARPDVINAVARNLRRPSGATSAEKTPKPADYDDLIDRGMTAYREEKDATTAVRFLRTAARLEPKKPEAYQMLGFVSLYGNNDAPAAETLMREAFNSGGSAVFRVFHDDEDGGFGRRCAGSLYISSGSVRFESDDNRHTFEFSVATIDKLKIAEETNREWKRFPVLRMNLRIGAEKAQFRFTPITGRGLEASMAERFVYVARNGLNFLGARTSATFRGTSR